MTHPPRRPGIPAWRAAPFALAGLAAVLSACFSSGPLVVRVDGEGTRLDGRLVPEEELDLVLEESFRQRGARTVELEATSEASADYLATLMDRIHWASRAAGSSDDCEIVLRTVGEAPPPPADGEQPEEP